MKTLNVSMPYSSARSPVCGRSSIATSQPLASLAGMDMLRAGGNAVDAAVAAAMVLTVVEPTGCGIGSDAFAIVWDGSGLHGLNASGRSPAAWSSHQAIPDRGWGSVTVPGAVSAWSSLIARFGRLSFETIAAPAIRCAREGFLVSPIIGDLWARGAAQLSTQPGFAECFMPGGRAPRAGELFRSEAHARTLESIAASAGEAFYRGHLAELIVAHANENGGQLSADDLADHHPDWVETLSQPYAGAVVHELPPNGQGIATLMALGILGAGGSRFDHADDPREIHCCIEATKLAMADLYRYVGDIDAMDISPAALLDPGYLSERAKLLDPTRAQDPGHGAPGRGGTVCLSAADEDGMMVSFIQSNYMGFGSGVVVPGTGISLQNRGAGFTNEPHHPNGVAGGKRPFHTIIPGFATNPDGTPLIAFGLMGGPMQAQGHVQLMNRILTHGQNPQAAADAPRWRILSGTKIAVEPAMSAALVEGLKALGHEIVVEPLDTNFAFGGAQIICKMEHGYVAGSDPRKDGLALAR
jgi:gamma-glutamyltranspeptidase/glutathione hydrolase